MEAKDLYLAKARLEDWEAMYRNVWSHPETARYMTWCVTDNEEDARARMQRTIEFEKTHDTYLVYEKVSRQAIGFAGLQETSPQVFEETGIALGPEYVGRGYGKQILQLLLDYADSLGAKEFWYSTRAANAASKALARSLGFEWQYSEEKTDTRNGEVYEMEHYRKILAQELGFEKMQRLQRELQERYRGWWRTPAPEIGRDYLLWMMIEAGEVADIIKKKGDRQIMDMPEVRKHFIEEMCDTLMYFNDIMLCYQITPEELKDVYLEKHRRNMTRWKKSAEEGGADESGPVL